MGTVKSQDLIRAIKDWEAAEKKSKKAAAARAAMGPGSCQSRRGAWTTANARWSTAAEERDKLRAKLDECLESVAKNGLSL